MSVPRVGLIYKNSDHLSIECQVKKINQVLNEDGREVTVAAVEEDDITNVLKVEVDANQCSQKEIVGNVKEEECDIKLASGPNLTWANNFSPKAIFQVSGNK